MPMSAIERLRHQVHEAHRHGVVTLLVPVATLEEALDMPRISASPSLRPAPRTREQINQAHQDLMRLCKAAGLFYAAVRGDDADPSGRLAWLGALLATANERGFAGEDTDPEATEECLANCRELYRQLDAAKQCVEGPALPGPKTGGVS